MKELNKYIDVCLIDEYADKNLNEGYSLDLDQLPDHEIANFLDKAMKCDTTLHDRVCYYLQKMIDERLPECESNDLTRGGYTRKILSNGDTYLTFTGEAA